MTPWLSIVGLGEDGLDGLTSGARSLIDNAEVLVGGDRHLAMVPPAADEDRPRLVWTTPLSKLVEDIVGRRGQRVCVLATGDPLWYGIGVTLARHIPIAEMRVIPVPSAFSLACARLGWSLSEVATLTLHGRPLSLLNGFVQPGARLIVLSDSRDTPAAVARILDEAGYGHSPIIVLEHMGGPDERIVNATAGTWRETEIRDFNTIAIDCMAGPDAKVQSRVPGLPDDAYRHDGQLTKREVRAATLAALMPTPGARLWDVGAGAGSVAIEWLRAIDHGSAVAIERDPDRATCIADNALALGTPTLEVVTGTVPAALAGLPPPDAVFIGGGLTEPGVVDACWQALGSGGRLVANGVTLESEARLIALSSEYGGTLTRLSIARAEPVGGFTGWRPLMPVVQWAVRKR
ncbi:MAG: precorrin-6y C5,15-methyltransferase (decarboxylating) subunit CbiE [Alphaproteobacteria bacterium]|nr:precorrin-6y C5,15-methyltransferase (decarboxylating) subunit CbiE [Alphaproteobacteria bacterium]